MLFRRSNALIVGLGLIESADSSEVSRGPPMYLEVLRTTYVAYILLSNFYCVGVGHGVMVRVCGFARLVWLPTLENYQMRA